MKLTWYKFSRDYQQKSVDPNFFHEYILIKDFVSFKKLSLWRVSLDDGIVKPNAQIESF